MRNVAPTIQVGTPATLRTERRGNAVRIVAAGDWLTPETGRLDGETRNIATTGAGEAEIDGSGITNLDSAGMWLLLRMKYALEAKHVPVKRFVVPEHYTSLLSALERDGPVEPVKPVTRPHGLNYLLERTGRGAIGALRQGYDMVGFLGRVTVETLEALLEPGKELPFPGLIHQIEETGLTALPIVGLLAFLIGVVITYQGADQLRKIASGAEIYTIDLLGVSILRELGVLITAIIVAGRSGSAFTAQIGTMRVNEEIDAMQTLGLNTTELLVVHARAGPRHRAAAPGVLRRRGRHHRRHDDVLSRPAYHDPRLHPRAQALRHAQYISRRHDQGARLCVHYRACGMFRRLARGTQRRERRSSHHAVGRGIDLPRHRLRRGLFGPLFHAGDVTMSAPQKSNTKDNVVIRIRGLVNAFGDHVIHDHIDLDVMRGEVLGVVGGSGTGKSVLLRSIVGLNHPKSGSIEVFGQETAGIDAEDMRGLQLRWGVLFQDGALFSSQTVAENIQVPLRRWTKMSQSLMDEIAAVKLALVGLPKESGAIVSVRTVRRHAQTRRPCARTGARSRASLSRRAHIGP